MHPSWRVALLLLVATAVTMLPAVKAWAAGPGRWAGSDRTDRGAEVSAGVGTSAPGGSSGRSVRNGSDGDSRRGNGGGSVRTPVCWRFLSNVTSGVPVPDGYVVHEFCPDQGQPVTVTVPTPSDEAPPGPPPVDPYALALKAASELVLPTPQVRLNPAADQIVQLPSWLWLEPGQWVQRSASASAGPVTATVTAVPLWVRWEMGTGDVVLCEGPGRVYEPRFADVPEATDCKYTYRHSSAGQPGDAYSMTVTVEWDLTWIATGAPGRGSLGTVAVPTTLPVRVAELQALVQ